jgi:hypothetical protein
MATLEANGFYLWSQEEYIIEEGRCTKCIIRDIFFILDKQIYLARRFISGFLYKTNIIFSINTRQLPLSVIVRIDNIGYMFPMAFMFIITKSAKSFKFASEYLIDLCFYNYP